MQKERHKLTPVPVILWIVATMLSFFGFRLVRAAMGHGTCTIQWLQVGAMALVGVILLALGCVEQMNTSRQPRLVQIRIETCKLLVHG